MSSDPRLPAAAFFREPELRFFEGVDVHPLRGLLQYGPLTKRLIGDSLPAVRVAMIAPFSRLLELERLVNELNSTAIPQERRNYLERYPGFRKVFGLGVELAPQRTRLELPADLDREITATAEPLAALREAVVGRLLELSRHRSEFDVVLVLMPASWDAAFSGTPQNPDADLRHEIKIAAAQAGVATQIIRDDGALIYRDRASVLWRLSIALYTKIGGVPWALNASGEQSAHIGLGYALRSGMQAELRSQFVVACSQIFDGKGLGPRFIVHRPDDGEVIRRNPYLSRATMAKIVSRSLALFQQANFGSLPTRLVIHKRSDFRREEVQGCLDACRGIEELELVQITSTPWRAVLLEQPRRSSERSSVPRFPVPRGSMVPIGSREFLLWTQGLAQKSVTSEKFYKEGKGIPHPLFVRRFAGTGSFHQLATELLALSKMNWNNDALYDTLPVTLRYASELANLVKANDALGEAPYDHRYFM